MNPEQDPKALRAELEKLRHDLKLEHERLQEALAQKAGNDLEGFIQAQVENILAPASLRQARHFQEQGSRTQKQAAARARDVLEIVCQRYHGTNLIDRQSMQVPVKEPEDIAYLAAEDCPVRRVFAEVFECTLSDGFSAQAQAPVFVSVRAEDPMAREMARRALRQILNAQARDEKSLQEICQKVRHEVEREAENAGQKAQSILGLAPYAEDVATLVGRLKFRFSYAQNQWRHSLEVGWLSGLIAEELGMDVDKSRRAGMLHDIGKAMSHTKEGSHALMGGEVAVRCGEPAEVVEAIAGHHFEIPMHSAIAFVATGADAMSGGRPGARREHEGDYLKRIKDLRRLIRKEPGIERVEIMDAGRLLQVIVPGAVHHTGEDPKPMKSKGKSKSSEPPKRYADHELQPLAERLAQRISAELVYPGQIRVEVRRESQALSIAH